MTTEAKVSSSDFKRVLLLVHGLFASAATAVVFVIWAAACAGYLLIAVMML